jgi:rSAM/selenodomain-associated transferase 1
MNAPRDGAPPGPRRALVVYARAPVEGEVKTRMGPRFGDRLALRLHEAMLGDTLDRMRSCCEGLATLWVSWGGDAPPSGALADLTRGLPREIQREGPLGGRMRATIAARVAEGCAQVILIGADTPHLPVPFVHRAFEALDEADVVLGPSEDGGYYLIGARGDHPRLFEDVPWGGRDVMAVTRRRLIEEQLRHVELPMWYDIDTPEDALRLGRDSAAMETLPRTRAVLAGLPPEPGA